MKMESLDTAAAYTVDNLLDFSSDVGEEDDHIYHKSKDPFSTSTTSTNPHDPTRSVDCAEEELEWLLNKDAFPSVDTFVDTITVHPGGDMKHLSPISVLENSSGSSSNSGTMMTCCGSFAVPVRRARTKRRRKHRRGGSFADLSSHQLLWFSNQENINNNMVTKASKTSSSIGRKCQHCQAENTPQWRAGPMGPKTLCNACGVRFKSGRLVPEYRPANSPTFSSKLHSNSHRKVVEMRKQKQGNIIVNVASVDIG